MACGRTIVPIAFVLVLVAGHGHGRAATEAAPLKRNRAGEFVPQRRHRLALTLRYRWLRTRAAIVDRAAAMLGELEVLGFRSRLPPIRALTEFYERITVHPYQAEVSPILTRGSRVDARGVAALHDAGYAAIIALTKESQADRGPTLEEGMHYLRLPILDNTAPKSYEPVKRMLNFLAEVDAAGHPVHQPAFIHCEAGEGRTGLMVAAYRMAWEGWSTSQALVEARKYGLVLRPQVLFIRRLGRDLAKIRERQRQGLLAPGPVWQYLRD
jgi:hypothetical protein